ncbi:MAG: pseudouridine-5'-phosphate glycosidase, partial [Pseudonocardia sp.]|nr:pseudouridine-5'-phosphate glycosidase [Pseudonocardia sp.]
MPHVPPHVSPSPEVARSSEVADALASGEAVVALESTILAHGLPAPQNRAAADELVEAVAALARATKVGPGRDADIEMGPVITAAAR